MINLNNIKNIVFDLGNVIIDIDFNLTVKAFQALGGDKIDLNLENYMDHPIFGAIEKGKISADEFRSEIRKMLQNETIKDESIDEAWAALIINSDEERIQLIKTLGHNYRLFILSNTDEIHIRKAKNIIQSNFGEDLEALFEKCYYSHELAMEKPNADIYHAMLNDAQIKPEETVFIDDKKDNVEAAQQLGIQAYYLEVQEGKFPSLF